MINMIFANFHGTENMIFLRIQYLCISNHKNRQKIENRNLYELSCEKTKNNRNTLDLTVYIAHSSIKVIQGEQMEYTKQQIDRHKYRAKWMEYTIK